MKPTILFDVDGTLMDSKSAILGGFAYAFSAFDESVPDDDKIISLIGYPLDIMFSNLGIRNNLINDYIAEYSKYYKANSAIQTKLINGVSKALIDGSKFADLGIVTTKNSISTNILLNHFKISKYFGVVIGKNDVLKPKPSPEPILKALDVLKKNKVNAFMIGDTKLDAISAKAAGITSIGVTCGYSSIDELKEYCANVYEDPLKAVKSIKEKL